MVHHVPHFLAMQRNRENLHKIALVVVDGLALDQWLLLRKHLEDEKPGWTVEESSIFAWVPTLTSISRQALFAGDLPLRFPDSLGTTAKEKQHWQRFWEDQGIGKNCADLVTNIDSWENEKIQSCLTNPHLTALGVVVNTVDDITHGMQLGTAGMHDQVRLWINQRHLSELLVGLAEQSFTIFLTADHGNVAATGMGQPREGLLVKERAKRCRVYQNAKFRTEAKSGFPETFEWPGYGLPPSHHVLLADDLRAFATKNDKSVAHGGIALEEVLVPFVRLKRNPT